MRSQRDSKAEYARTRGKAERDVEIAKRANPARRKKALGDVFAFLEMYFGHRFYNPLTEMHREIVREVVYRAEHGGDKAIAAPRKEGKTTIAECVIIYAVLRGLLKFPVIVAANGDDAKRILDNIKNEFETNELLGKDFPEVCGPIVALEGGTARQNMQTVDGKRTYLKWMSDMVIFPLVPKKYKSPCGGTILMTRGLDAAIRGLRHKATRPDFVLIDDPETRESAASELQIKTREQTIDRDIAGLGGQGKKIGRLALVTLQNQECLAARLTDRDIKPSWSGQRFRVLKEWPKNKELWEQYIALRKGKADNDQNATVATEFYLANRAAMDEGVELSNPFRYVPPLEHSALQAAYNFIADNKMDAFMAECQNDPQDESEENGQITSAIVGKCISGYEHRELPVDCEKIVSFIDLGEQFCNWVDVSWQGRCIGSVLDYGTIDVRSGDFNPITKTRDPKTLEIAILQALNEWRTDLISKYRDVNGQPRGIDLALVDSGSGLHTKTVYRFCREAGAPFAPSKGREAGFRIPKECSRKGDFWAAIKQADGTLLYEFDSTEWKKFSHQRFLTPTFDANHIRGDGSLALFVCPQQEQFLKDRREYTHQMVAKIWGQKRPGAKPGWIVRGAGKDHYEDATAGCCLAANIVGIKIQPDYKKPRPIMSLQEMAEAAKRKAG